MKILNAYILKELAKIILICVLIFSTIYIIIDFVQKIDRLIESGIDNILILEYFLLKIPFILVQMVPPATLLSIIIMISMMKKKNEIIAIKACGIDIFSLAKVMLFYGLLLASFVFLVSEYIVTYTNSKVNDIWNYEVEKRSSGHFYGRDQIWYRATNRIYWIKHYDYYDKILQGASFYFFDDDFRVIKKVDGNKGVWEDGQWIIKDGVMQVIDEGGEYKFERFDEHILDIPETPETFVKEMKDSDELGFFKMREVAEKMQSEGYDNSRYIIDMNIKVAYPVIIVIMVMIGFAVPLMQRQVRIPLSVMAGILTSFLYMAALGFSRSLGLSGVFPPFLAAWFANFLFLLVGAYLMSCVDR